MTVHDGPRREHIDGEAAVARLRREDTYKQMFFDGNKTRIRGRPFSGGLPRRQGSNASLAGADLPLAVSLLRGDGLSFTYR
jgi:hypothetical protein